MRLDLSADPWGAAMLGAAGLAALGLVIVLLALAMRTSKRGGAWILALGCTAFLATSVLGTLARVREADAAARSKPPPAGEPVKIVAPEVTPDVDEPTAATGDADESGGSGEHASSAATPTDVADGTVGTSEEAGASGDTGAGGDAGEAADTEGEPRGPEPPAAAEPDVAAAAPAPSAGVVVLEAAPALPTEPAALREAVLERLRAAKSVALDDETCLDAKTLGETWAGIAAIPKDVVPDRVAVIVRRLDKCRRRIAGARAWMLRRERAGARKAFAGTLRDRLKADHAGLWVGTSGKDEIKLRMSAGSLAAPVAEEMLAGGLKTELEALGFQGAFFSDGKKGKAVKLEPKSDDAVLEEELRPYGLHEAFAEP